MVPNRYATSIPRIWVVVALGAALLVAGCGQGKEDLPSSPNGAVAAGDVTYSDYESAVLAQISCLEAAGFEVSDPTPLPGRQLEFLAKRARSSEAPDPETADPEELRAFRDALQAETMACDLGARPVIEAWLIKTAPSEETLAAAREALAACLRKAGEEVPESPGIEEFVRLQQSAESFDDCSDQVSEEYQIAGFAG